MHASPHELDAGELLTPGRHQQLQLVLSALGCIECIGCAALAVCTARTVSNDHTDAVSCTGLRGGGFSV